MDKSQKRTLCQLTSVVLCSLFWIALLLKMGPIGCPETHLSNYRSIRLNSSEERRSHMTIWHHRPWFGSSWSGSEQFSLVWSCSMLHTQIYDDLTHLSAKFKERTSSCIWVNTDLLWGWLFRRKVPQFKTDVEDATEPYKEKYKNMQNETNQSKVTSFF
jgi:hypothetical protein